MVVEDKHKLLSPILSRFCGVHVPRALSAAREVNFHTVAFKDFVKPADPARITARIIANAGAADAVGIAKMLYEKGCTIFDVMSVIEKADMDELSRSSIVSYLEAERLHIDNDIILLFVAVSLLRDPPTGSLGTLPIM